MTVKITNAEGIALETIHEAMLDAFSDYDIPLQPDFEQFERMLRSRQFTPSLSSILIENEEVQSFWIIGKRGDRGHLAMSGTRPSARGLGYAKKLAAYSEAAMRETGIKSFQFEVLTTNERAISLYEKLGHTKKREFDCFSFAPPQQEPRQDVEIESASWKEIADLISPFKDFQPSWQADNEAIAAIGDAVECIVARREKEVVGYLAATPSGSIMQLAVATAFRRQNIATQLLANFATTHSVEIFTYVNIDMRDTSTIALMNGLGAKSVAQQFEMHKSFD